MTEKEISVKRSGVVVIHGQDAFKTLKAIWDGRIDVAIPSPSPETKTGKKRVKVEKPVSPTRPDSPKKPRKVAPIPEEVPKKGDWFEELRSLTEGKEKEV